MPEPEEDAAKVDVDEVGEIAKIDSTTNLHEANGEKIDAEDTDI